VGQIVVSAILTVLLLSAPLAARSTEVSSSVSNAKARALVQEALDALGDQPTRTVFIHAEGREFRNGHGPHSDAPVPVSRLALNWKVDLRRKRLSFRREEFEGNKLLGCYQYTIAPQAHYAAPCHSDAALALDLSSIADAWTAWMQQEYPEPSWQLEHAWSRVDTLEYGGETFDRGVKQYVVSYTAEHGARETLYFNAADDLLAKVEGPPSPVPSGGTFVPRIEYEGYRSASGAMIPSKVTLTRRCGLEIVTDVLSLSTVRFDEPLAGPSFAAPEKEKAAVPWQSLPDCSAAFLGWPLVSSQPGRNLLHPPSCTQ
jgi:hypothetical protein